MAEEFQESDLQTGIPLRDIPESGFKPVTMTLEPPQELPSPRQFVPTAAEDTQAFAPVSFQQPMPAPPTQEIAELEAGGFQWPSAEPVYPQAPPIISIAPEQPQYAAVDEGYAKTDEYFSNGFTDQKFLARESDNPAVRELEAKSFDPANVRVRGFNWAYLQWKTGKRFQSDAEYETARDEYSRQNDFKPVASDTEFFANRKKGYEQQKELKQAATDLLSRAVLKGATDYAQGQPLVIMPILDELRPKYKALNDPDVEKRATIALRDIASNIKQKLDPLMPQIGKMMPHVKNLSEGKEVEANIEKLRELLVGDIKTKQDLTPDKVQKVDDLLGLVTLGVNALDPDGKNRNKFFTALDNLKKAVIRPVEAQGLFGFGGRDSTLTMQEEMILEARRRLDAGQEYVIAPDGRIRFLQPGQAAPPGSRQPTPAERATFRAQTETLEVATWFEDKIRDSIEKQIDPIRTVLPGVAGTLERTMVYGALQSAGFMATGILPAPVSDVAWWWMTRNMEFRQLMRDNPQMAREDANRLSNWSATWQAPLNRAEGEILLNRVPALKGVLKDMQGGNFLAAATKLGVKTGVEFAAESTQNFISNVTQAYGNMIADETRKADPSWPKASEQAFRETVREMPDTLLMITPMMLIGAGIGHIADYRMTQQELAERFSLVGLMSQGLGIDQALRVMSKRTYEEKEKQYQKEYQSRDPETMREANAKNAADAAESQAQFEKQATAPAMPSWHGRRLEDGTIEYTVRDSDGNVVTTTTNRTVFEGVYQEQVQKAVLENLVAQVAAAASEEGQAATAEAEGALRVLEPESRTSAAYLLEFEDEQRPTPERAAAVARLEAALAKDPRSGGRPIKLIAQTRRLGPATESAQKLNETIDSLGRLFGKDIVFVRSGTGEDLPFTGIVNSSDPNTIFLDAAGNRNVLALIGHEWSHALKLSNPQLHAAMVAQMRPLVYEWLNQEAKLREEEGYTEAQVTDELVGNIIGDAFTRPDFLRLLAQRNPSLFERVVRAIQEFLDSLIAAARGSEWATEGFITDLEAMDAIIASTIEQARTAGPEVTAPAESEHGEHVPDREQGEGPRGPPAEGEPGLSFATRRGKAAQAAAEGISREASVAAAFERMHAAPGERLGLLERIKREYSRIRAQNVAAEAAAPVPVQVDPTEEINQLEAQETKALEDLDVEEQAALDASSQQIADRYADRILAEQDIDARRALERESRNVAAAQRKGIEKQFDERRKAIESDFRRQQQAVMSQAEQANLAATKEGAAQLAEMRRVHAFAELNALVKALPPAIRGRIGGAMTLAQARTTEASLTDFLTKRIAMIDRELERALKAEYTERIKDLLARFKPKRAPSGVVKGRIGSDAQDVVNRITDYIKMSGLAVQDRMRQIENELAVGGLEAEAESALLIEQHELSTFGAIDEMSAAELSAAHASLQDTIATGRAAWGASEEARLADMRAKAEEIVDVLPPATAPGVAQKNRSGVINWLKNYARNHTSFVQILSRLFPKASFVSDWESKAIKQDSADMDYVRQTQQRLVDAIGMALGTKSTVRIGDALSKMDKQTLPVPGGKASQREAIQYLFAWGQPQVQERMLNQGWTPAHIVALQEATKDPVSQALMTFFREQYEAIYQRANVVYQKLYGMNLPRIEGTYAPMRYHGAGGPADISPTGVAISSGVTPSAIKGRVAHSALLRQVDSLAVFSEHLAQMSHWIHFAEFIRETRGVLNNATAKLALEQAIGAKGLNDLQKHLDSVTRNGVMRASDVSATNDFLSHITKGTAISAMAFNFHSAAVQGDSALRWMAAIPIQRWGNVLLAHRWLAAIPKAWHSDTVQRRVQGGMNPAVRFAMEQNNFTPSLLAKAVDVGFWPINLLDGAATAISSAIVYADSIAQGMSEEQALRKMDEAVARFSQPIAVTSKTQELATAGSAKKMLLMFMADPMLKTSIAMDGMLDIGRGKFEQGFRKIVAVELWSLTSQLILNTWAHYITGDDEEDEDGWLFKNFWRAAIVAPVQGFFVLGNIAEGITRMAFGEKWWKPDTAVGRFVENVVKTASNWQDVLLADPSDPDFQKEVSNLVKVGGTIAGSGWAATGAAVQRGVAAYQEAQEKLKE